MTKPTEETGGATQSDIKTMVSNTGPRPLQEVGLLLPGDVAGDYIIERMIASGGGGSVYAAKHKANAQRVALKVLHVEMVNSPEMISRFMREAAAVNQIRHPSIVDVSYVGNLLDGRPFQVMELLEGVSLHEYLKSQGPLPLQETYDILSPLCSALQAAHDAGFIHRDIKASNVFLAQTPEGRKVKLLDFGIAKLLQPDSAGPGLTLAGSVLGTPHAMAPEQILGKQIDARTDIYALGVLLFQMLTSRFPFFSKSRMDLERMHLQVAPPRVSQYVPLPLAVDAIVTRCLEKQAARRYPSATAVLEALRELVAASSGSSPQPVIEQQRAIGIYVHVAPAPGVELDDDVMEEVMNALTMAESLLVSGGFQLCLQTSEALLAVRVQKPTDAPEDVVREETIQSAVALHNGLCGGAEQSGRVAVTITVHADHGALKVTADGVEVTGGAIVDIESWARKDGQPGVWGTPMMIKGLHPNTEKTEDGFITLLTQR